MNKSMILFLVSTLVLFIIIMIGFVNCTVETSAPETSTTTPSDISLTTLPSGEEKDLVDSDGDGVADELEINGYYWKDGEFHMWNGDPSITYYCTDPTQPSTDQDPYSDGMEVSGIKMDTSVAAPGNHPLVPAYPDIYVSMVGYDVEAISEITNSTGGKTQQAWSNSTTDEKTTEHHWEVSVTIGTETGLSGFGQKSSITATAGGSYGSKHSTTSSTSGFTDKDWSEATTLNPAEAGKIKLRVRFENRGTAAGQNIIPTVNIILGDKTINTYEMQEDKTIDTLAVGQVFPATGEWVIGDKPHTLQGMDEIILTLDELKSIQLGVPIFLDMPQIDADVLAQDEDGHWEVVDTWQHYQARIDGVCARITVDLGDGNMKDYRVFARSPNGPLVTLREALAWTVGCEETASGIEIMGMPVGDWRIGFSQNAIEDVGAQLVENNVLDVVLDAGWTITIKAPTGLVTPEIVWCEGYQDEENTIVKAAVIDDYAVSEVLFKSTPEAEGQKMESEWEGTGIYELSLGEDYKVTGEEIIKAINDRGNSITESVEVPRKAPLADGIYVITSANSNKALDIDADIPVVGSNVIQYNYAGINNQQWELQNVGNGYYRIMNTTGLCLEVVESRTDDYANVQLNEWQNGNNQKWALEPLGDGTYNIIVSHSDKYLDIEGSSQENLASAVQNAYSGSNSQKWVVQLADSYPTVMPVKSSVDEYFVILNKESGTCIKDNDTYGGLVHLSMWDRTNQRWQLAPVGEGYFMIYARDSENCLTMVNNVLVNQPYTGDDNQKWLIKRHETVESDPGYYYYEIENKESGLCLTYDDTNGNLVQQQYTGGGYQKWHLIPTELYSWENNITITFGKYSSMPAEDGWVKVGGDLNKGAGGEYIYLWVRGPNKDNIAVTYGKSSTMPSDDGWIKVGGDLNKDVGGDYIYLWVRGPGRSNIAVIYGTGSPSGSGWIKINKDLNEPWGMFFGRYIYLWIR